jgi:hypothetical protein
LTGPALAEPATRIAVAGMNGSLTGDCSMMKSAADAASAYLA